MQAPNTSIPPLYRYNISKLPLDIFINLSGKQTPVTTTSSNDDDARKLHYDIVYKLKHVSFTNMRSTITAPISTTTNTAAVANNNDDDDDVHDRITTVAKLLQLSPYAIFHRLDPILTLKECIRLYQRICIHCTPNYTTAHSLLSSTTSSDATLNVIQPLTSTSLLPADHHKYVSTGWDTLDQKLHGGIRIGTITELIGCAGTGKTQLALQTTITTALSSNHCHNNNENDPGACRRTHTHGRRRRHGDGGGGTIWIDTEQKISLVRLQEMTIARCRPPSNHRNNNPKDVYTVLENVTIHSPSNLNEFVHVLDSLESEIIERNTSAAIEAAAHCVRSGGNSTNNSSTSRHDPQPQGTKLPVRLIVIDSIAAAVGRTLTKTTTAQQQAIGMMQIAQLLKRYADQYSIAILIINQVTSTTTIHSFPSSTTTTSSSGVMANCYPQQFQRAALGTAWHHCVTTRIELQQYDAMNHGNHHNHHSTITAASNHHGNGGNESTTSTKGQVPHRQAQIVKSLTVEPSYIPLPFHITVLGIVD